MKTVHAHNPSGKPENESYREPRSPEPSRLSDLSEPSDLSDLSELPRPSEKQPEKLPKPPKKLRLDTLLVQQGRFADADAVLRAVLAHEVKVGDAYATSAAMLVLPDAEIEVKGQKRYVSRGGLKLAAALEAFDQDVRGMRCLDIGSSTGGFTDCLLQAGAAQVSCVDVNYGQLAWKLRQDPRVQIFERTNIKSASPDQLGAPFDLLVIDVSFIGLAMLAPAFPPLCHGYVGLEGTAEEAAAGTDADIGTSATADTVSADAAPTDTTAPADAAAADTTPGIAPTNATATDSTPTNTSTIFIGLVKPQFESHHDETDRGVVRDKAVRMRTVDEVCKALSEVGFRVTGAIESPLRGPDGNVEYLVRAVYGAHEKL